MNGTIKWENEEICDTNDVRRRRTTVKALGKAPPIARKKQSKSNGEPTTRRSKAIMKREASAKSFPSLFVAGTVVAKLGGAFYTK